MTPTVIVHPDWTVVGEENVRCNACGGIEARDPRVNAPRFAGHEKYSARHLAATTSGSAVAEPQP